MVGARRAGNPARATAGVREFSARHGRVRLGARHAETSEAPRVFTVGHSTRTLNELVDLLKDHGIVQLVDGRHYPRSRRNRDMNQDGPARELSLRGSAYA